MLHPETPTDAYLSPHLRDNPGAALDTLTEVEAFLSEWGQQRLDNARDLYDQLRAEGPSLPTDQLRAITVSPAAHDEHPAILQRTVHNYVRQDADPRTWGVLAFLNPAEPFNQARTAIQEGMPTDFPLYTLERAYAEPPPMGLVRADVIDSVLYHIASQGIRQRVLIISNDFDNANVSRSYVRRHSDAAAIYPQYDFYTCKMTWDLPGSFDSRMSRAIRYFVHMDSVLRLTTPHFSVSEANIAIDAAAYAAVGGFSRTRATEQMAQLRQAYATARSGEDSQRRKQIAKEQTLFIPGIFLKTSSRRLQIAFARGFGPHQAWDEEAVPFSTVPGEDKLDRSQPPEAYPTELDEATFNQLITGMDEFYGNIIRLYNAERFERARLMARRLIGLPVESDGA
jgi:hypothetical protein